MLWVGLGDRSCAVELSKVDPSKANEEGFVPVVTSLQIGGKFVKVYLNPKPSSGALLSCHLGRLNRLREEVPVTLNGREVVHVGGKGTFSSLLLTPCFLIKEDGAVEESAKGYASSKSRNEPFIRDEKRRVGKLLSQLGKFKEEHPEAASYVDDFALRYSQKRGFSEELLGVVKRKEDGQEWVVSHGYMPFGKRGDLYEFSFAKRARRNLSAALVRTAFNELLALIGAKVCHEDIKPENMIVDKDGHAHLIDFGWSGPISPSQSRQASARFDKSVQAPMGGTVTYFFPKGKSGQDVSPVRVMVYAFCLSFCVRVPQRYLSDRLDQGSYLLTPSEEDIASLKRDAEQVYANRWVQSDDNKRLFNAMLRICEEGWRFGEIEKARPSREQLQGLIEVLGADKKLSKLALDVARKPRHFFHFLEGIKNFEGNIR